MNMYGGPEYLIHYKYSSVMNICFVVFLYGIGMPLLFPIGFLGLCILYTVEKLCVAYYYQSPPAFDEKLDNLVTSILIYAPLGMFLFGYWMMSNHQIFQNDIPIQPLARPEKELTNHVIFRDIAVDQALPFFVFSFLFAFIIVAKYFYAKVLFRKSLVMNTQVDEELPPYFAAF